MTVESPSAPACPRCCGKCVILLLLECSVDIILFGVQEDNRMEITEVTDYHYNVDLKLTTLHHSLAGLQRATGC